MFDTAQKRTTNFVLENMSDADYIRIDDSLDKEVKMDEINPAVLSYIKTCAESNALKYDNILDSFAKQLIQNMEDRKNASETGRA